MLQKEDVPAQTRSSRKKFLAGKLQMPSLAQLGSLLFANIFCAPQHAPLQHLRLALPGA